MSVAKTIEIIASSKDRIEDAVRTGLANSYSEPLRAPYVRAGAQQDARLISSEDSAVKE